MFLTKKALIKMFKKNYQYLSPNYYVFLLGSKELNIIDIFSNFKTT